MGILSSLFGIGGTGKQATTTQVIQSQIPKELSPFVKEILSEAQALYGADIERGYDPYTALTTAPFTAEQLQAQEDIKGLRGTQAPFIQEALGIQREGAEKFTPEVAQEYMSPYQRAVTDIEKREAETQFERNVLPRFEKRAVDAGGLSGLGTRAGVEAAELQRGQSQLLADIEAKGLQSSFMNAQQQFAQQKAREQQMAANIGRTGPALFGATLAEAGAAEGVGAERRELAQSGLDEAYFKFLEEQQFPQRTLAQYQGSVYGNPMLGTPTRTTTTTGTPYQPSMGQNLLGLGLTGLNIYGMGGGFGGNFSGQTLGNRMFGPASGVIRKGGGSVGMSDKNLGKYMEQGSGAISAKDRNRLMSLYKSGLSGLPVVRRQAGTQVDMPIDIEEENVDINFPYIRPQKRVGEPVRGLGNIREIYEQMGYRPETPGAIQRREQEFASELAKKTREFETGEETARAKRFERRMERAKEGNPMARFAAIQKAIQAGVMGEQGLDIVEGMKVYGEEMAPLNEKMSDLINTIDEEDEAIKAGQRKRKHERLINTLKTDKELQERLTALPRKNMQELLADLANIGTIEKLYSEIDKNEAAAKKGNVDLALKLRKDLREERQLVLNQVKAVVGQDGLLAAATNPETMTALAKKFGLTPTETAILILEAQTGKLPTTEKKDKFKPDPLKKAIEQLKK
jgi:hypothetical protein